MEGNKTTEYNKVQNDNAKAMKKNKNNKKLSRSTSDNAASTKSIVLKGNIKPVLSIKEALNQSHEFWSTQPVPKPDEEVISNEPVVFVTPDLLPSLLPKEPYILPDGFRWDTLNLTDPLVLKEFHSFLNENYVEYEDSMFRFAYPEDVLKWALQPPGWTKEWHCGVRVVKSGRLVGFISAIPIQLRIYDRVETVGDTNFLCVHKRLRAKRLAPILIKEIARRISYDGVYLGIYTAGIVLPKPIATCRYWHRSLNPKKLIDIEFSHLPRKMTMRRTQKLLKLPDFPKTSGFRKMEVRDCQNVVVLLNEYLRKFALVPVFSEQDVKHWFIPQEGVVSSFVVEAADGSITDFVSYYAVPSAVSSHPLHKDFKAAYSFYNVSTKTPWTELMLDCLISAKNAGFDLFNALEIMDNKEFLEPLKFVIGTGSLRYYLYNWKCPIMNSNKVGFAFP